MKRVFRGRYRSLISLIFLTVLIPVAMTGCYTYHSLSKDDQKQIDPNNEDAIRLAMKDGSVIESPAFMHVATREPSDLIVGTGQERSTLRKFKGVLRSGEIDSVRILPDADGESLICWLKNKSSIAFKSHEYLKVTPEDSAGLWCLGKITSSGGVGEFRGIVSREQLADVEVEQFDMLKSVGVVASLVFLYEIGYQIYLLADRMNPLKGPR